MEVQTAGARFLLLDAPDGAGQVTVTLARAFAGLELYPVVVELTAPRRAVEVAAAVQNETCSTTPGGTATYVVTGTNSQVTRACAAVCPAQQ